jgi:putative membrane protein
MNKNVKTALIIGGTILGIIIILPLVFGAISGWQYGGWGMMGPGMMSGFGWMWLMPVFWIVVLGLIIWAVVAAVRGSSESRSSGSSKADSALEVLKKRYARGEINKEEYEEKKRDLA